MNMRKEFYYGVISGLLLLLFYGGVTYVFNGPSHVVEQIREYGFLIFLLVAGFGIQVGLFFYGRSQLAGRVSSSQMAATSGTSAGTMIACCLHHAADVLPFLGLSGAFLFFSEYQFFFMTIGVVSSIVGITIMLSLLQRNGVFPFPFFGKWPWLEIRNMAVVLAVVGIAGLAAFTWLLPSPAFSGSPDAMVLSAQTDSRNSIEVKVVPYFSGSSPQFDIEFTTHQTDLDFFVEKISFLSDERGEKYFPVSWEGSAPGGHHRSGKLRFDSFPGSSRSMMLTLQNVGGVNRTFTWSLGS